MNYITNPILKGFNPDPSIIRVGDDYYIATSTFEWFPGVQIHHSKDLVHWELVAHPLNRTSQLDMKGNPNSGGIWAPCLSYDNGLFYLIYTDVKTLRLDGWKDTLNYLVTTEDICGEWSEPIYLNSSGFDPSLFHDEDGRKWLVNMINDHRKGKYKFGGIVLQEYDTKQKKLIGPVHKIFGNTELGLTEGPHLYKKDEYYYLMMAEGGTSYGHAVTLARSRDITGPYEVHPNNPMLTSADDESLALQKAGHASLVETQNGEWYIAHLCGRPLTPRGRCVLGRETSLQKVIWKEDGWLYLENGSNHPDVEVPAPNLPQHLFAEEAVRDDFDSEELSIHFQTLRVPLDEDALSLTERPGYLRLKGKDSIVSHHKQTLVARRQQAFCYRAATCVEFEPENYHQMAGLVCWYNTENFYYLAITHDEEIGKCLRIITCDNTEFDQPLEKDVCIEGWKQCYLKVEVDYDQLQFYYSKEGEEWKEIGPVLDSSKLSDEYANDWAFTGAYVGLCCQDMSHRHIYSDFDFFEYEEK